jgi:tRNA pseudouridine38-40 synthase
VKRTLRLVLAYDGCAFRGWQRQPDVRTVQAEVEHTLQRVLREPISAVGASRTDAGVHARGQVAHVVTSRAIPERNLCAAIGHHLPPDVGLVHLARARDDFHATRDARSKLYRYVIHNATHRPVEQQDAGRAWHVRYALDTDAMRAAADALVGTHDFAAFAAGAESRPDTVRTVWRIEVARRYEQVVVDIEGGGFLYNQVRNMVGTLVEVGRGHWPVSRVPEILASRRRVAAGPTAPPHGLYLQWVRYDAGWRAADAAEDAGRNGAEGPSVTPALEARARPVE